MKDHIHMYLTFAVALKAVNGIGCSESWKNLKWNIKKITTNILRTEAKCCRNINFIQFLGKSNDESELFNVNL